MAKRDSGSAEFDGVYDEEKYTHKQLFLRCLERNKSVQVVARALGVTKKMYLTWVVDDKLFERKVEELLETFGVENANGGKHIPMQIGGLSI